MARLLRLTSVTPLFTLQRRESTAESAETRTLGTRRNIKQIKQVVKNQEHSLDVIPC